MSISLKKNVIFSFASQVYAVAIGILILPLYIKYIGAEAYGLIGFFTMLQAWFNLLDIGLTPTIARETARFHGKAISALVYRQLFRALSIIFFSIALIGGLFLYSCSDLIANRWLKITFLPISEVNLALQIMAITVALRWLCGLYRGVVTGFERLVWLSGFNIIIATLRFVAVFFSMFYYGYTVEVFFFHQLIVAFIEVIGLCLMSLRLLPLKKHLSSSIGWSIQPVKPVLKFALTIAFTSSVWVLVTQADKLILSGVLPLDEYGYFTLAVLVASGILMLTGPVSSAIMPRMAKLYAEGNRGELIRLYRNSTQLVSVVAGSASIVIAFLSEPLLYVWTGDRDIAKNAAPILTLYVLGYGVLAIAAFPYYLQYAIGNLRYHLIGNVIIVVCLIPAVIFAAQKYGGIGAGWVWLSINTVYLLTWVAYVHHKLEPGLHWKWLIDDGLKIYIPVSAIVLVLCYFQPLIIERVYNLLLILFVSIVAMFTATLCSGFSREWLFMNLKGKK